MTAFVDTSAIFAWLDFDDRRHESATETWAELARRGEDLVSSNYVLLEANVLLSHRLGLGAVHTLQNLIVPLMSIHWVDQTLHESAMGALLTANRRELSLVDCVSFEVMRFLGLQRAFVFDPHFRDQGFATIP